MMRETTISRRRWLQAAAAGGTALAVTGLAGCGAAVDTSTLVATGDDDEFVTLYDTYAMALYFDGSLGPKTGVIAVSDLLAGTALDVQFWHGHGGRSHRYAVSPDELLRMRNLEKVTLVTTAVDNHTHKLFVDFSDSRWRVPGAQPVRIPRRPTA